MLDRFPDDSPGEPAIVVYLLEFAPAPNTPAPGSRHLPAYTLRLRYLVAAAASGGGGLELLDRVLTTAADTPYVETDLTPLSPTLWTSLSAPPRPAFIAQVLARRRRTTEPAPMVTMPLTVLSVDRRAIHGRVVGPDDVPLAHALVEALDSGAVAHTAASGHFVLDPVPDISGVIRVAVRAKGRVFLADLDPAVSGDVQVIRCDPTEG